MIQPPGQSLIDTGGIPKTIGYHPPTLGQGGPDFFLHVLAAVGQIKKQLGQRIHFFIFLVQQNGPDLQTDFGRSRFPGDQIEVCLDPSEPYAAA